jgi:putative N-acetyltransferase (TIGR04045 family)
MTEQVVETIVSPFSKSFRAEEAVSREAAITCRLAASSEERALHWRVRDEVFVREQALFAGSDRDEHDDDPATLFALGLCGPVLGGAVRLYPLDDTGLWKGDRLAVLPPFRKLALGAALVRFAVRTAGKRGGTVMVAYVQVQNVGFFEHLGWRRVDEPFDYVGRPHQKMVISCEP